MSSFSQRREDLSTSGSGNLVQWKTKKGSSSNSLWICFRSWEDRSAAYVAFANQLLQQLQNANPDLKIIREHHWTMRLRNRGRRQMSALGGALLLRLLRLVRRWDPDRTIELAGQVTRSMGPWLRGQSCHPAEVRTTRSNRPAAGSWPWPARCMGY